MSLLDIDLITGRSKLDTSIMRIKEYCRGKKVLVAFSGGKDSQCCYHLCKDAGIDFHAEYSITRFEPPELMHFVRKVYPDVTLRRAYKRSLYEDIKHWGLPNRFFRFCCEAKHKKTEGYDIAVIGIRFAESARRRARWSLFGQKQDKTWYICPICDWSDAEVWEYLNEIKKIPHCKLYDEGYKRIGCVCCPLSPKKSDALRWPKIANNLRNAFYAYYEEQKKKGFKTSKGKVIEYLANTSKEELFDNWLREGDARSFRYKDHQGEDLPCLFAGTGFSESDGLNNSEENLDD